MADTRPRHPPRTPSILPGLTRKTDVLRRTRNRRYTHPQVPSSGPASADPLRQDSADRADVVIGIVRRADKVLICQRPQGKAFAGYWEFPGGKREPGELIESCLRRELREELAIDVIPQRPLTPIDHDYPRGRIRLLPYLCTQTDGGEPRPLECQQTRWVCPPELRHYHFPPANDCLIEEVIASLAADSAATPPKPRLISPNPRPTLASSGD